MGKTRLWGDVHFGSDKVARERGYDSTLQHDAGIIDRWARVVSPDDTVYVLGDVGDRRKPSDYSLQVLADLPGTKVLITGNHDEVHPLHPGAGAHMRKWLGVFEYITPFDTLTIDGRKVLLCHFPYAGDKTSYGRYAQWRLPDLDVPLIHAHVHTEWGVNGHQLNVGADALKHPVELDDLRGWIAQFPKNVALK